MKLVRVHAKNAGPEWHDTLQSAFDSGLPGLFSIEWLIDKAERGEWGGLWW